MKPKPFISKVNNIEHSVKCVKFQSENRRLKVNMGQEVVFYFFFICLAFLHLLQRIEPREKYETGSVFTKLHFLCNLQTGPISKSVCPWQAFLAQCNVNLQIIVLIHILQRKCIVVNIAPGSVFTTPHFLHNLHIGPITKTYYTWQERPITGKFAKNFTNLILK